MPFLGKEIFLDVKFLNYICPFNFRALKMLADNKIFLSLRRMPRLRVIALNCVRSAVLGFPFILRALCMPASRFPTCYITVYCSGEMLKSLEVGLAC